MKNLRKILTIFLISLVSITFAFSGQEILQKCPQLRSLDKTKYGEVSWVIGSSVEKMFINTQFVQNHGLSSQYKNIKIMSDLLEKKGSHLLLVPVPNAGMYFPDILDKTDPLIKDFNFSSHQTTDAIALLKSDTGKYIQSATHRIIKNRNWLIITPNETDAVQNILIEAEDERIIFANGEIKMKRMPRAQHKMQASHMFAQLDANDIQFPLLLRKWKQGDYFYPLGMDKKKKLSRFFTDQKLSLPQKENVWVVEMNKKIIWVVGMRIDNRFKTTASTQQVLILEMGKTKKG